MILHDLKNKESRNQSVSSAICGIRCDSIELDAKDVGELMELSPEMLKRWLENVSRRFRPEFAKPSLEIKPFDWGDIGKITKGMLKEQETNEHEFKKQFMCDFTPELKPLTEKEMNRRGPRFDETINKRLNKDGPIVIIQSRLHEQGDPGFTFD